MAYTKNFTPQYEDGWENLPSEDTPITADALNDYDGAIEYIEDYLAANDIVSVEANPQDASTESLTKIEIDGTVYSVSGGGGASALDDLTDVDITTPTAGQALIYDAINSKWVNGAGGGGGNSTVGIADIYTTVERQVGVWTDGKPLYQRSFHYSGTADNADFQVTIATLDATIEMKHILNGGLYRGGSLFNPTIYAPSDIYFRYIYDPSDYTLGLRVGASLNTTIEATVTIQYTKTTDTPTTLIPSNASALYMMGDVAISSVQDGQVLKYNATTQKWENGSGGGDAPTILTSTLSAGSTSLTFSNAAITTTAMYDVYADKYGLTPTDITITTGQAVLTFEAQSANVSVKLVIR